MRHFQQKSILFQTDEFCEGYPHNFTPTPGYWIECSRQSGRGRRDHGIQEESSQEDSSPADDDDDDDQDGDREDDDGDGLASAQGGIDHQSDGLAYSSGQQRQANGGTSVFTSTESGTSDRVGRKVQLVHQHIQVDDKITVRPP